MFFGRAAVYGEWSQTLSDSFIECLVPGCFDASLDRSGDVIATVDHDLNRILGRTSAGTLRLVNSPEGLDVEVQVGDYSYARDLIEGMRRGDLRGMSFIFDVLEDSWARDQTTGTPQRTVLKADLFEVSFVHHPAYEQTDAGLRSIPRAFPIAGEERAKQQAKALAPRRLALSRARVRLAELS